MTEQQRKAIRRQLARVAGTLTAKFVRQIDVERAFGQRGTKQFYDLLKLVDDATLADGDASIFENVKPAEETP